MQPLLHNNDHSPTPPPPPQRRGGGGHRIHSDGDDGRLSGVLKLTILRILVQNDFSKYFWDCPIYV